MPEAPVADDVRNSVDGVQASIELRLENVVLTRHESEVECSRP
jgi:hypothetical protein